MTLCSVRNDYKLRLSKSLFSLVPRSLTEEHTFLKSTNTQEFLQRFESEGDDFVTSIVTGDESCRKHNSKVLNNTVWIRHQR